jgi:hypothetical protein
VGDRGDLGFRLAIGAVALLVVAVVVGIGVLLVRQSWLSIQEFGVRFWLTRTWDPVAGEYVVVVDGPRTQGRDLAERIDRVAPVGIGIVGGELDLADRFEMIADVGGRACAQWPGRGRVAPVDDMAWVIAAASQRARARSPARSCGRRR